jgi:hypothetical protein
MVLGSSDDDEYDDDEYDDSDDLSYESTESERFLKNWNSRKMYWERSRTRPCFDQVIIHPFSEGYRQLSLWLVAWSRFQHNEKRPRQTGCPNSNTIRPNSDKI